MPPKIIISDTNVPVKIWSDSVEDGAMTQLRNVAALPFIFKHVAVMPDVHLGVGATIGSVVATRGAICPASVGVDIGCGMMAVKTDLSAQAAQDKIIEIRKSIERSIPVGHEGNRTVSDRVNAWEGWKAWPGGNIPVTKAAHQMGSLGGGNHFIEVCLDKEQNVWFMLHSGSRNIGKTLAERHIDRAKSMMKAMFIRLPDPDLAYFAQGTVEFQNYVADVKWCQQYAQENREEMMRRVVKDVSFALYGEDGRVLLSESVNCHHNYIAWEHHFGENVMVTRKGAVRARLGDMGIIPGSMGTRSYIVRGLGNPESFNSCSHGAGRRMSRGKARATFKLEDLAEQTLGVECRKDVGVIDEIPGAYKDIDVVMANQSDLVEVVAELKQFCCIKG